MKGLLRMSRQDDDDVGSNGRSSRSIGIYDDEGGGEGPSVRGGG